MLARLLSALVTACKQRADMENDTHIGDTEWKSLISEQVGELHQLADEAGLRYFETTATITATGASSYTLPTDHLATVRIWRYDSAGRRFPPLREVQVQEDDSPLYGQTGEARCYAIIGQTIELYPNPTSGTYAHRYVPQPADLSAAADATSVDVICPTGLTFVVAGVAVKALPKSESSIADRILERDQAREATRTWLIGRSMITPRRMVVANDDDGYGYPRDPGDYRWTPP